MSVLDSIWAENLAVYRAEPSTPTVFGETAGANAVRVRCLDA
jgi:hypothetical protein